MKKLLAIVLLSPVFCFSQKNSGTKLKWNSLVSTGIITGANSTKLLGQLTSGISYNRYFTGFGIGYDAYRFNTIPVFVDWKIRFGKENLVFVYAAAGYNFPGSYKRETESFKISDRIQGGFYVDGGIGYRPLVGRSNRLLISTGYSRKNVRIKKVFDNPCGFPPCTGDESINVYQYGLGRILIKVGWEF